MKRLCRRRKKRSRRSKKKTQKRNWLEKRPRRRKRQLLATGLDSFKSTSITEKADRHNRSSTGTSLQSSSKSRMIRMERSKSPRKIKNSQSRRRRKMTSFQRSVLRILSRNSMTSS
mgnify:CR=1 FL=1